MSTHTLAGLVDVLTIKRTELVGVASAIVQAVFSSPERGPDDPMPTGGSDESEPAEWWQAYGLTSRPPMGSQALVGRFGATIAAFASRAKDAIAVFGKMAVGDVALYTIAGNVLRLNADRSVSLLVPCDNGKQTIVQVHPKDSAVRILTAGGLTFEMSDKNGIAMNAGAKDVTIAGKNIQFIGTAMNCNVVTNKLNATAGAPLVSGPITKPNPGILI